jgi:2-polyprenyl-3-methyl-5-hydroxy-6-metoxy-1,4-benzoquinol methylase
MKRIEQTEERLQRKNEFDGSLVFGTRDFNKRTRRNEHVNHSKRLARDFFIDPQSGLLYNHMAENRDCPICGGKEFDTLFVKDGFCHVKCRCGFIFVNPTASDKYRDKFFRDIYQTWTEVLLTPEEEVIDTCKFNYGLEFIENHIGGNKGLIVDAGAGSGLFLKIARDAGWKVSGVEFNQKAVENIRNLGIEVFDKALEEGIYAPNSVDVVTIWEVLEHINMPDEFIKQIRNILNPGGLLFVCVPNINALVTRILHEEARTFGGHTHVNFFSIGTLSRLLEKHGFEALETDTVISELGTIKNYLSYEDPYGGESSLELDFLTPEYLYKHNLGSRIFMLARKKGKSKGEW